MLNPQHITIKEFQVNSPAEDPKGVFLLAHGVGKGMGTPFLETIARGVVKSGVRVVRFNFPYMEEMLRTGQKVPPNGRNILRKCFSDLIVHCIEREGVPAEKIIIGGKSTGARIASMVADNHKVAGVVCLGYPFHLPKKPEHLRIQALKKIQTPTLICQGERDPRGKRKEIRQLSLSKSCRIHWLVNGNSNFKPGKYSPWTQEQNMEDAIEAVNKFINTLL